MPRRLMKTPMGMCVFSAFPSITPATFKVRPLRVTSLPMGSCSPNMRVAMSCMMTMLSGSSSASFPPCVKVKSKFRKVLVSAL